jgi:hypothetical protein
MISFGHSLGSSHVQPPARVALLLAAKALRASLARFSVLHEMLASYARVRNISCRLVLSSNE